MIKTKDSAKKDFSNTINRQHYLHKCDFCNTELVLEYSDFEKILFEPREVEHEARSFTVSDDNSAFLDSKKEKFTVIESSDVSKDMVRFKCPYCGHIIETNYQEFLKHTCSADGEQHMIFVLDDEETKAAKEFMHSHNHSDELMKKKGNPFFSALGQQFTFEIIPGGLGNSVIIKCNHCGDTKDITNSDCW